MINYGIFTLVWSGWLLLVAAWMLAFLLGRAFHSAALPAATAPLPDGPAGPMLSYAPAPVRESLLRRYPGLAGICAMLVVLFLLQAPVAPAIAAWAGPGVLAHHAYAAMAIGVLTIVAAWVIARRGLRRTEGIPAAAGWPRRKLLVWVLGGIPALLVLLVLLDMGAKHRMQRLRDAMDAQSESLAIPLPAGTANAADIYRQAFALVAVPHPAISDWSSQATPSGATPSTPPEIPAELEEASRLLRRAAGLPVADWGIAPKSYSITILLPHLAQMRESAMLLHAHAVGEAHAGRLAPAVEDIHALRAMARHAGQGQLLVEGLVAIGINAVAIGTTEDVLPFVTDERILDELVAPADNWNRDVVVHMLRGDQASTMRTLIDIYNGKLPSLPPRAVVLAATPANVARVFTADAEMTAMVRMFDDLAGIAGREPAQALADVRQYEAQLPARRSQGGMLSMILMPSLSRSVVVGVRAGVSGDLCSVGIAARRFYLRNGRLPASFDELTAAKLLQRVPTDPFSGRPILLKVKRDEIVIYSVGEDRRDDGGDTVGKDITFRVATRPLWEIDQALSEPAAEESQP